MAPPICHSRGVMRLDVCSEFAPPPLNRGPPSLPGVEFELGEARFIAPLPRQRRSALLLLLLLFVFGPVLASAGAERQEVPLPAGICCS